MVISAAHSSAIGDLRVAQSGSATISAAATANTGWQRAASQSRIGNSTVTDAIGSPGSGGTEALISIISANATSATTPSTISLHRGGLRRASVKPIISGETAMAQCSRMQTSVAKRLKSGVSGWELNC